MYGFRPSRGLPACWSTCTHALSLVQAAWLACLPECRRPGCLQGVDNVHACYGGTAALLHAADWVAGPSWDGRLALVVGTDIAIYEEGSPARATGAVPPERQRNADNADGCLLC